MAAEARLFGTDGVRGLANRYPVTPEMAFSLGRAGAEHLQGRRQGKGTIIVGRDTRLSGDMLEAAICAGICAAGVDAVQVGVLPTPAIAYLTRAWGALGGVVLSASHNAFEDNGVKFFAADGFKLPDAEEDRLEQMVRHGVTRPTPTGLDVGRIRTAPEAIPQYLSFARAALGRGASLTGLRVVVDCANGAVAPVAPLLFEQLGAQVIVHAAEPDGTNINQQCGALFPEQAQELVRRAGADVGFCFDGDGDRLIAIDETATVRDGDYTLGICAQDLVQRGELRTRCIVGTVMSNYGLEEMLQRIGIGLLRAPVGDKYVLEEMRRAGAMLGGEQSGHIVFLAHATTGDGLITALQLLRIMQTSGRPLSGLSSVLTKYPQVLLNVRIRERIDPLALPEVKQAHTHAQQMLNGTGRILVRLSGTEPLARVMVEGRDSSAIQAAAEHIAQVIERAIGVTTAVPSEF
ncbi:MAG TPA: phosphoglucosamine mutase [Candidatus Tectomicrobia bacterium]|nr:phosphoglucosamine mutase [Candidatus Tectomicrobia bacterium]